MWLVICIIGGFLLLFILFIFALCKSASDADDMAERAGRIVEADRKADKSGIGIDSP